MLHRYLWAVASLLTLYLSVPHAAVAQTGPGGVGENNGTSDLQLWMRAGSITGLTDGAFVNTWPDASGYGHNAEQPDDNAAPIYRSNGRNSRPTVEFGGPDSQNGFLTQADADEMTGAFATATDGTVTYFVVGNNDAVTPVGPGPGGSNGRRALAAFDGGSASSADNRLFVEKDGVNYYDGSTERKGGSISQGAFVFFDVTHDGSSIDGRLFGDNVISASGDSSGALKKYRLGNDQTGGDNLDGNLAEVIVFDRVLNEAERLVVQNYLSSKYDIAFGTTSKDKYAYDGIYGFDVAGIGRQSSSATHLSSNSSILNVSASSFSGDSRYVFVGHNDGGAASFGFEATEPVNGLSSNVERMAREWRVDLSGVATKTVTVSIKGANLPARSDGTYEYFLFVDEGDAFSTSPVAYTLQDDGTGTYTANVELSDGNYLTIGAGRRVVSLDAATADNAFENTTASPNASLTVQLNLPYSSASGTDVGVAFTNTGDLDGSGTIEDSGTGNVNGVYEASASDYNVSTTSPVTISAGSSTASVNINLTDDGGVEQTEKFNVALDASGITNADIGSSDNVTFSINDDDDPRKLSFTDVSVSQSEGSGGGTRIETFVVTMPSSEEAATKDPLTTVDFEIIGTSTATAGDDIAIVDESDPGGNAEYQEGLSMTTGRIHFSSADGTTTAELKLAISEDDISENDESVVVKLINPVSSALAASGTELTFTLTDDETPPTVQFAAGTSEGGENVDGTINVTLSEPAGNTVSVDFALDNGASTATQGSDFALLPSGNTVTFAPGSTSESITVDVSDDSQAELGEAVAIDLSAATNATLGSQTRHTYTINDNDATTAGSTGPGGVGGAANNKLWLRASSLDGLGTGAPVSVWGDRSGNANDASQTGSARPTLQTNILNSQSVVRFDGTNDNLRGTLSKVDGMTMIAVGNSNATNRNAFGEIYQGGSVRNAMFVNPGANLNYYDGSTEHRYGSVSQGEYLIFGVTHQGASIEMFKNGDSIFSTLSGNTNGTTTDYVIGNDETGGDLLNGDIAEFIVYSSVLNATQRTIVENYLSARYDIALNTGGTATDVYAGDTNGNGDYDRGVFGIGRTTTNDFHVAAETDGLRFDNPSGFDNGEYLLAGHKTPQNAVNTTDVGGVSGLDARMERTWYLDTDALTADATFDLAAAGLSGPAGAASGYVLLQRTAGSGGAWTQVAAASSVSGSTITFSGLAMGSDLSAGDEITIGTTDRAASPLTNNALLITGTSGTDGRDQGWRYLGLPVTGGTAGDLLGPDGTPYIDFSVAMAYTNPGDDGTGNGWQPITSAASPLTNGRGFIVWLFDDAAYPVDPFVTLRPSGGLTGPGAANVTVGDGSAAIGSDPTLATDDEQFLLANPYSVPFSLGSLTASGFDDVVQIWAPDAAAPAGVDDGNAGSFVTRSRSANDRVAPWQGFFLTRTTVGSGATKVTFNSSGRAAGQATGFVGSKQRAVPAPNVPLVLRGYDANGALVALDRAASVVFRAGATAGRDRFDAPKLQPMTQRYAIIAPVAPAGGGAGALRARESRPRPTTGGAVEIPLAFVAKNIGHTFDIAIPTGRQAATETYAAPEDWRVLLVDTKRTPTPSDDVTHELTPGGAPYQFSALQTSKTSAVSRSAPRDQVPQPAASRLRLPPQQAARTGNQKSSPKATTSGARFLLRVEATSGPLPVEMAELQAAVGDQRSVTLQWTTASETNNAGFYVQHQRLTATDSTADAADWDALGFVPGSGTTTAARSYRFTTDALDYGRHAFRLQQVDANGTVAYSKTITAAVQLTKAFDVQAPYPNPAQQRATLPIAVRNTQRVTVAIYDVLGRRVSVVHNQTVRGQQTKQVQVPTGRLASGLYFVRIRGERFATTRRLTVVR